MRGTSTRSKAWISAGLILGIAVTLAAGCSGASSTEDDDAGRVPILPRLVIAACLDNSKSVTQEFFDSSVTMLDRVMRALAGRAPRGDTHLTIRMFGTDANDPHAIKTLLLPGLEARPSETSDSFSFDAADGPLETWETANEHALRKADEISARIRKLKYVGSIGTDVWNCVHASVGSFTGLGPGDSKRLLLLSDFVDWANEDAAVPAVPGLEIALVRTCPAEYPADRCRAGVEAAKQRLAHIDGSIAVFESTDLPVLDLGRLGLNTKA